MYNSSVKMEFSWEDWKKVFVISMKKIWWKSHYLEVFFHVKSLKQLQQKSKWESRQ